MFTGARTPERRAVTAAIGGRLPRRTSTMGTQWSLRPRGRREVFLVTSIVTIEDATALLSGSSFQDPDTCARALVRMLVEVPATCVSYVDGESVRALFIGEHQVGELIERDGTTTVRAWPLDSASSVRLGSRSPHGVWAGATSDSYLPSSTKDLTLEIHFAGGETLEVDGLRLLHRHSRLRADSAAVAAFFRLATQLTASTAHLVVEWPVVKGLRDDGAAVT